MRSWSGGRNCLVRWGSCLLMLVDCACYSYRAQLGILINDMTWYSCEYEVLSVFASSWLAFHSIISIWPSWIVGCWADNDQITGWYLLRTAYGITLWQNAKDRTTSSFSYCAYFFTSYHHLCFLIFILDCKVLALLAWGGGVWPGLVVKNSVKGP